MRYRTFGRTGLRVSEVGLGCWELSGVSRGGGSGYGEQDDRDSIRLVLRAAELGVNFFDTADAYGLGHSEVVLGRALKELGDTPVVATKVGNNFYRDPWRKQFDSTYVRNAAENSLQRLGLDRIDLYQLHGPSMEVLDHGDVFQVLDVLVKEGKILNYGVSVFTVDEALTAMERAPRLAAIMCPYNLLEQECSTMFAKAVSRGVAVIARSPLASGRLTGTLTRESRFPEGDYRSEFGPEWVEDAVEKAENLGFLIKGDTETLAQAALKFILADTAVTVVIPGAKTLRELEENIRITEGAPLSREALARIRELRDEGRLAARPSRTAKSVPKAD